jgi:hypothetical protein
LLAAKAKKNQAISQRKEMKILQMPSRYEEPFACRIGLALWQEYLRRNPDGLKVPPEDLLDCTDLELAAYVTHVDSCDDCNEV